MSLGLIGGSETLRSTLVLTGNIALIEFPIPTDFKFNVSSKSSQNTATSLSLSNSGSINGSIAYLYTSTPLIDVRGTKDMSLQEATAGYRIIRPPMYTEKKLAAAEFRPHSLYYGRMYFPGSALEAMVIQRLSKASQFMVKCVSNDKLKNNGTMTFYYQTIGSKLSREYIFSTNEALLGLRCLYSFKQGAERLNTALYNNASLSVGAELWYGALNMSPGLSTALRYSTQSTYTGKPLTMTLACNPILGHISSTYSVKTSANSTFSSRYDFNVYSYDSDLSFGCELWRSTSSFGGIFPIRRIDPALPPHVKHSSNDESVVEAFESLMRDTDFSSVVKLSTTLNDKNVKFLWEGKYKDFLLSAGFDLQLKSHAPDIKKYGFQIQYSS